MYTPEQMAERQRWAESSDQMVKDKALARAQAAAELVALREAVARAEEGSVERAGFVSHKTAEAGADAMGPPLPLPTDLAMATMLMKMPKSKKLGSATELKPLTEEKMLSWDNVPLDLDECSAFARYLANCARECAETPGRLECLTIIDLSGSMQLTLPDGAHPGARAIAESLCTVPKLQTLRFNDNRLSDVEGQLLMQAISRTSCCKTLERLWLEKNELSDGFAMQLAAAAPVLEKLDQLHLADNAIGDEGIVAIATALWPNLSRLSIANNSFGDEGAVAVAEAVKAVPDPEEASSAMCRMTFLTMDSFKFYLCDLRNTQTHELVGGAIKKMELMGVDQDGKPREKVRGQTPQRTKGRIRMSGRLPAACAARHALRLCPLRALRAAPPARRA